MDAKNPVVVVKRESKETRIVAEFALRPGTIEIQTGIGFLDHLLTALARHAAWSLRLNCEGDLEVDDHHSVEDAAIVLGTALKETAAVLRGIRRFGSAYAPLDEALARAVVDFSARPWAEISLGLRGPSIGSLACENIGHFLSSFAASAGICLHVDLLKGENDHHRAEAAFKALALALREALGRESGTGAGEWTGDETGSPPSTKGKTRISIEWKDESPETRP